VTELPLEGGDVNVGENVVVRVGDTVRRPAGPHTAAVHALLRWLEAAAFDGAPRVIGRDGDREVLSFVPGDAALPPVPSGDEAPGELGALLRAMHDAQAGFDHAAHAPWQRMVGAPDNGEVVCHNDLFWPNVVFVDGHVRGLVDWDLAAPAPRLHDLASAANFWVALRPDDQCEAWGVPIDRRRDRLRALCDGYGLPRTGRAALLDAIEEKTRIGIATYRAWGRDERRPGWAELWDRDGDRYLVARAGWFEAHRQQVAEWLR
jgi:prepilin-type processing-associated H-X9-DG protein